MIVRDEDGAALVIVLMTMLLMTATTAALVLTTSSEALIAYNFRGSRQALYAAEAAAEWALVDLSATVPDWATLLNEAKMSWFVDGVASGTRLLADGSLLDIGSIVQLNVNWQLYAFGPLKDLLPPATGLAESSPFYLTVFVAPDPAPDRLRLRAEAFGPRGAHKILELGLRRDAAGVHLDTWREVR